MAIIDLSTGIIRGKLGNIVFEYRMGTNYARKYVAKSPPPSEKLKAHRKLFAQLQHLGSIWLAGLIKPYYTGDLTNTCAYRQFIKYNWPRWDKIVPAWTIALPFWGYAAAPVMAVSADEAADTVTVDLFPPQPSGLSGSVPHFLQIRKDNLNWMDVPDYQTLSDRHRVIISGAAAYKAGDWNMLCWYSEPQGGPPITDPVRG
jgi:hypothetical protein